MDKFWDVLSVNKDENGIEFISTMEAKAYPFFGSQFHPEKNPFEWKRAACPHSMTSIRASQDLANFFVEETRRNCHKFKSATNEHKSLIYNFQPQYTAVVLDSVFQQQYFFNVTDIKRFVGTGLTPLRNLFGKKSRFEDSKTF